MPDTNMPKVELGRPATYDDLVALPDIVVGEIVDDELWSSPRPAPRHAKSYGALGAVLVPAFDFGHTGPGGWQIVSEPELHLATQVLVPDLGGWRRDRMPRLPETAYFPLAPDWVCEVLSPSTARLDRAKKLRIYAEFGVGHAWLVDPSPSHAGGAAPRRGRVDTARHARGRPDAVASSRSTRLSSPWDCSGRSEAAGRRLTGRPVLVGHAPAGGTAHESGAARGSRARPQGRESA